MSDPPQHLELPEEAVERGQHAAAMWGVLFRQSDRESMTRDVLTAALDLNGEVSGQDAIERMARAISARRYGAGFHMLLRDEHKRACLDEAQAALSALLTPKDGG